jgi:hypothetical protein
MLSAGGSGMQRWRYLIYAVILVIFFSQIFHYSETATGCPGSSLPCTNDRWNSSLPVAYATLVFNEDGQYLTLACALGMQLKRLDPGTERIALVPRGSSATLSSVLGHCGWSRCLQVTEWLPPMVKTCSPPSGWSHQFAKLELFKLIQYRAIFYMDADTYVFHNPHKVFTLNTPANMQGPLAACEMVGHEPYTRAPFSVDAIFNACTLMIVPSAGAWARLVKYGATEPPVSWGGLFRCTELAYLNVVFPDVDRLQPYKGVCFDPWRYTHSPTYGLDMDTARDVILFHNLHMDNVEGKRAQSHMGLPSLDLLWGRIWDGWIVAAAHINTLGKRVNMPVRPPEILGGEALDMAIIIQSNRAWTSPRRVPRWLAAETLASSRFRYGCPPVCEENIDKPMGNVPTQVDIFHLLLDQLHGTTRRYLEIGVSAGKTFSTMVNALSARDTAVAFDIEEVNPTLLQILDVTTPETLITWTSPRVGIGSLKRLARPQDPQGPAVYYVTGDEMERGGWEAIARLGLTFNFVLSDALHTGDAVSTERQYLAQAKLLDMRGPFLWAWDDCDGGIQEVYQEVCARTQKDMPGVECRVIRVHGWLGPHEGRHTTCLISTMSLAGLKAEY